MKLKDVDYEYYEEDLSNKSSLLLKYNPVHKKFPAFLHNDKAIAEWARFIDEKCFPALWKASWGCEDHEKVKEEAKEHLKALEDELKDNKFFGEETIGLVDIVGNIIAYWLPCIQEATGVELLTEDKYPKLYQWSHEFVNHDVVKEKLPPSEKLIAFFRGRLESNSTSK